MSVTFNEEGTEAAQPIEIVIPPEPAAKALVTVPPYTRADGTRVGGYSYRTDGPTARQNRPHRAVEQADTEEPDYPELPAGFKLADPVTFDQGINGPRTIQHAFSGDAIWEAISDQVVFDEDKGEWVDLDQWIYDIDPAEYVGYQDQVFNDDFWAGVDPHPGSVVLYHGTSVENAKHIEAEGLLEEDIFRGMTNRSTGPAVFATRDKWWARQYAGPRSAGFATGGGALVTIDVGAMKRDGFTPFLTGEEPLMQANARDSVAWALEVSDFHDESADYDGLGEETVVIRDDIPPKYLSVDYLSAEALNADYVGEDDL